VEAGIMPRDELRRRQTSTPAPARVLRLHRRLLGGLSLLSCGSSGSVGNLTNNDVSVIGERRGGFLDAGRNRRIQQIKRLCTDRQERLLHHRSPWLGLCGGQDARVNLVRRVSSVPRRKAVAGLASSSTCIANLTKTEMLPQSITSNSWRFVMVICGKTHKEEVNGKVTRNSGWLLSLKRHWCWWHHLNEAGCRAIQVGPVILEIWDIYPQQ